MSNQDPPLNAGDPPIIIQGGSVSIIVPATFSEETTSSSVYEQVAGGGGRQKDFKNGNVSLINLQIDENTPIPLNKNSRITITYK
ncbi:MAG TPA: hypothetical protein VF527_07725 [Pyrinomonadaceae bacterium]|jgi:hypothetical protein